MAGSKVSEYSIGDVNLSALMTTTDAQRIGYHAVSLTEYTSTTKPEIAAGSKVEVNGALFKFDSDETITETPSDGDVYIKTIPAGTSITAEFVNDAPTWDDEKQGWYESATNNRYLNYLIIKSGASYTKYKLFPESDTLKIGDSVIISNDLTVNDDHNVLGDAAITGSLLIGAMDSQSIGSSGYIVLGSLKIQWGAVSTSIANGGTTGVSYPSTFSSATYSISMSPRYTDQHDDFLESASASISAISTSGFTMLNNSGGTVQVRVFYIAIGA